MPGDWTHWLFLALFIFLLALAAYVWWLDRDRTYTEDDLKEIEWHAFTEACDRWRDAA